MFLQSVDTVSCRWFLGARAHPVDRRTFVARGWSASVFSVAAPGFEPGFHPFAGDDATWQPADLADVWLHETVAARVREFLRKRTFKKAETLEQNFVLFKELLGECQGHINQDYEVGDLCRGFPQRLRDVVAAKGDRLKS